MSRVSTARAFKRSRSSPSAGSFGSFAAQALAIMAMVYESLVSFTWSLRYARALSRASPRYPLSPRAQVINAVTSGGLFWIFLHISACAKFLSGRHEPAFSCSETSHRCVRSMIRSSMGYTSFISVNSKRP